MSRRGRKSGEPFGYQGVSNSLETFAVAPRSLLPTLSAGLAHIWRDTRYDNAKIRIGYLAGEFRQQATSILMAGLFELHDRARFETSPSTTVGTTEASFASASTRHSTKSSTSAVERPRSGGEIRQREIDILVNLNGYFGQARTGVFAHRAGAGAGQLSGLSRDAGRATSSTTSSPTAIVIPPERRSAFYAEKIVQLPDCYQVNDRSAADRRAHADPRREPGLPDDGFVFCCFNNNYKITPRRVRRLDAAAAAGRRQRAVAARGQCRRVAQPAPRRRSARGIAPDAAGLRARACRSTSIWRATGWPTCSSTRCPTTPTPPPATRCGRACRSLTCDGRAFAGRVAASLLQAVGLPELVTDNLADYEALALRAGARSGAACGAARAARAQPAALSAVRHRALPPPHRGRLPRPCGSATSAARPACQPDDRHGRRLLALTWCRTPLHFALQQSVAFIRRIC